MERGRKVKQLEEELEREQAATAKWKTVAQKQWDFLEGFSKQCLKLNPNEELEKRLQQLQEYQKKIEQD